VERREERETERRVAGEGKNRKEEENGRANSKEFNTEWYGRGECLH
jgi:hypothetical protein